MLAERLCNAGEQPAKKQKLLTNEFVKYERLAFSAPVPKECEDRDVSSTDIFVNVKPADSRMSLFKRKVVPQLVNKLNRGGVLIYFTQTIDLYNVQAILKAENLNVAVISE